MKKLFLLASIVYSINCFSQDPNPLLFQTWYLRTVQSNDLAPIYDVLSIVPAISPTLTISNPLNFTGVGACNTFNGTFTNLSDSFWQYNTFTDTGMDCGITVHNQFEDNYFGFLQTSGGWYNIYPEGTGYGLVMYNPIFGQAVFQNFPLSSADFKLEQIILYPNPTKNVIFINANQLPIYEIRIINSLGQMVKIINGNFDVIDMTGLDIGVYILKMDTEVGTIIKKIFKE